MPFFRATSPIWTIFTVDGKLAAGGRIDTYRQDNKTERKATYLDPAGEIPAPNPIRLDELGQIPYDIYWNSDELYYIEIYDASGRLIDSYENFPIGEGGGGSSVVGLDFENNLRNGQFRFNFKPEYDPLTSEKTEIAQFWHFQKSNESATDKILLNRFSLGDSTEGSPIYRVNYICTSQGSGETFKDFWQQMADVRTFEQSKQTFSIQAYSDAPRSIEVLLKQHFGTGGAPSSDVITPIGTFNLSGGAWEKHSGTITFPSTSGKTRGTNDDDYIAIIIRMPLDTTCNIQFTNCYLSSTDKVLPYPRLSKEKEDSELLGAMIPDIQEGDFGKAIMVDDSYAYELAYPVPVGAVISYAGINAPYGFLYCHGNTYSVTQEKGKYKRLYGAIERLHGYGIDAFVATNNGESITVANTIPAVVTFPSAGTSGFTVTVKHTGAEANHRFNIHASQGMGPELLLCKTKEKGKALSMASSGNGVANIYTAKSGTSISFDVAAIEFKKAEDINPGDYFLIYTQSDKYCFWYRIDNDGNEPSVTGYTFVPVDILSTDTAAQVAIKTQFGLSGYQITDIACVAASQIASGSYFTINTYAYSFYVWFKVGGIGADPKISGKTGILVALSTSDTASDVSKKVTDAINSQFFQVPDYRDAFIRGRNADDPADSRFGGGSIGSIQYDQVIAHSHKVSTNFTAYLLGGPNGLPIAAGENLTEKNIDKPSGGYLPAGQGGHETRPYNIYADYIIKY